MAGCRQEVVGRTTVCGNLIRTVVGGNLKRTSAEKKNGRVVQEVVRRILISGNLERTSVCKISEGPGQKNKNRKDVGRRLSEGRQYAEISQRPQQAEISE